MIRLGAVFLAGFFFAVAPGWGQHQHHGGHSHPVPGGAEGTGGKIGDETSARRAFLLEGNIQATFVLTDMAAHRRMLREMRMKEDVDPQATHNISVTLTDTRTQLPLMEAVAKMKVISPEGKEEIKVLERIPAMNQYSGDFRLAEKGRYEILILFREGGKKGTAGFYYRRE